MNSSPASTTSSRGRRRGRGARGGAQSAALQNPLVPASSASDPLASVASGPDPLIPVSTTVHPGFTAVAADSYNMSIIAEVRAMRDELANRLDGFNLRLGAVEQWQRGQPDDDEVDEVADETDPQPWTPSRQPGLYSPVRTTLGPDTPPFVTRRNRDLPPHLSSAALSSQLLTTPSPTGASPLDRFKALNSAERRKIRRAMNKLGIPVPELSSTVDENGSAQDDTTEDQEDTSNESPLRPVVPPESVPPAPMTPAPNIRSSGNPISCKQEFLGKFTGDPSRLEAFLSRVRDVIRSDQNPAWLAAVLRALPIALSNEAAVWHEGIPDSVASTLTSFEAWATTMRKAFPVNTAQQRREARDRRWIPTMETALAYYFHKVRLLRQAFGFDQTDESLVIDITDGLPTSFSISLRISREHPTLDELQDELGRCEFPWRDMYKIYITNSPSPALVQGPSTALGRLAQQAMVRSASAPAIAVQTPATVQTASAPAAAPPAPSGVSAMTASYDPSRVIPAQNGEPRKYRVEGRTTPMRLNRPCGKCGGDHFNFEHAHLVPQVRAMTVDEDDDYPFEEEVVNQGASSYYTEESQGLGQEEIRGTQESTSSSIPTENGFAPSMSNQIPTHHDDSANSAAHETGLNQSDVLPTSTSMSEGTLFLMDRPVFSTLRPIRPNETVPPLAQPKRAFGNVVVLPKQTATGTGQGYRAHVPLTAHIRINDTDGRALSTLVDTGASLSCIDASLLKKMGGSASGSPMHVKGIGDSMTLGWATLPVFLHATDPHGKHVHLEFEQDFHILPEFPPGLCLGLDFITAYDVSISPTRGRGRIDRYTFQVRERVPGPFAAEAELASSSSVSLPPGFQTWVSVNAACLVPGVDYTVAPRLSITPDESVRLAGPVGLLHHGAVRHILVGNYGSASFELEKGTVIADATAARIGDRISDDGELFHLGIPSQPDPFTVRSTAVPDPEEAGLPLDVFEDIDSPVNSLTQDADTALVDGAYRVGVDSDGNAHAAVVELLRAHSNAFALDGRPGQIEGHDMAIHLEPNTNLPPEPPRRASPEKRAAMDAAIEQLLDWDVIEPSQSPVSFPVVMVKQNGKWRFCVDYRQLNSSTVPDRYPLPTIDAIFQTLCGKKWFSSLDAIRGYHQLGVVPEDRWKTAFVCHRGLYQYKRVPFGLRNAPAVFQRMMDKVLGNLRWQQAVVYIDDSVIATDDLDEHLRALETLLRNAEGIGLRFSPTKCTFAVPSLTLLGRKVSGAGVAVWQDRAQAVQTLARPHTLQELYHTLGLFGYYRAFVPKFAEIAAPLTRLLKGWRYESADGNTRLVNAEGRAVSAAKVPLSWGSDQQASFEALRAAIANPPVLAHPDPSRPYILYTDASKGALAAILHQVTTTVAPVPIDPVGAHLNTLSVSQLPSGIARDRWAAWLSEDKFFAPILRRVQDLPDSDEEWVLRENVLVRRSDDRIALPAAGLPVVLRHAHDAGGHFGFWKTFLAVRKHFWRPQLSTAVRAWVKHCDPCRRTKSSPKTGMLDITKDPTLPFDHISLDLIYGFPRSRAGNDAALVIQDLFSRMVLLEPCTKDITAEGVAAIVSNRVLRFGWRPRRLVSDSEARVSGSVMSALCESLGAVSTPSSPYHQQANSVERVVQTVHRVLQVMALPSKSHWDRRLLPSVELAINSSPSSVTGHRPFDLIFISHPTVVHAIFDAEEHLGVGSFDERLSAAQDRLDEARQHILAARVEQKRRYDSRRANPVLVAPGMSAWIRLRDRPVAGTVTDQLDARKLGPFPVEEVLSAHRVRLTLPPHLGIDPVFNIEQIDVDASADDPFVADRAELPVDNRMEDTAAMAGPSDSVPIGEDVNAVEDDDLALPPRVRRHPAALGDFVLGTVRSSESDELEDLLRGPLPRPRVFQHGNDRLLLTERPIAFLSRLTSPAESKLVASELELVCFTWAHRKLAHLLEGAFTTVITDHSPMERMLRSTTNIPYGPTITRCRAEIMPHLANLRFLYRPGARHTNADALSRLPVTDQGRSASEGGDVLATSS